MLNEHKVFTTSQIVELCYPTMRAANHRLLDLFKWRVVDRFQPFISSGSAPKHYVLDIAGAVALAYEDGLDPKQLGYRHEENIGIAHSLRLAHTVGVNGFFSTLVALSRQPDARGRLTAWWSERRCGQLYGDVVRPDAYGRWHEDGHEIEFFLEFDFGTEDLGRLASKLRGYEKLATSTGITTPVLVWLPGNRRETGARRALADALSQLDRPALVPVATSAADLAGITDTNSPAVRCWLPVASSTRRHGRVRLAELAQVWPQLDTLAGLASPSPQQSPARELTAPNPIPPTPSNNHFRTGGEP
ncbi:replication-relaxation family protein [Lentzea sp. NPDC051838]|uniref:replication-relaxation family protein n=1 Tax=Lentzea sp. NPDC051838 TaxID=3154849 RepID=UPI0034232021